jgi:predicted transcriptional regulator
MPKVRGLTVAQKIDYQRERISDVCEFALIKARVSKTEVAEYVGVTPQAVWNQFRNKKLTTEVLMASVTLSGMDAETVKNMLTISK